MTSMLRPALRPSAVMRGALDATAAALRSSTVARATAASVTTAPQRLFATQSGDDAHRPTALAKIHLEDGTTLTGRSFGCHESVEGEVGYDKIYFSL